MQYTSKEALAAAMREQITRDGIRAARALVRIYQYQSHDEKQSRDVRHRNGVGFMPHDAKLLSGIACWVLAGHTLTEKQFACVRDRIGKYAGQLVEQAISRGLIRKVGKEYLWGKALQVA